MGFDVSQILSDDKHYSSFICSVCQNLVSLDAVVTSRCSHPFCLECMDHWASVCAQEKRWCSCPSCKEDLSAAPSVYTMRLGGNEVAARPLREAQPLAFQVLSLVQVACLEASSEECGWSGDYGSFISHSSAYHGMQAASSSKAFLSPASGSAGASSNNNKQGGGVANGGGGGGGANGDNGMTPMTPSADIERGRPALQGWRSVSLPHIFRRPSSDKDNGGAGGVAGHGGYVGGGGGGGGPQRFVSPIRKGLGLASALEKNASPAVNPMDDGATYESGATFPPEKQEKKHIAASNAAAAAGGGGKPSEDEIIPMGQLHSPGGKERWKLTNNNNGNAGTGTGTNTSIYTNPPSTAPKTTAPSSTSVGGAGGDQPSAVSSSSQENSSRDAPPNMVKRTMSAEQIKLNNSNNSPVKNSASRNPPVTLRGNRPAYKRDASLKDPFGDGGDRDDSSIEGSYSHRLDWNTSMNQIGSDWQSTSFRMDKGEPLGVQDNNLMSKIREGEHEKSTDTFDVDITGSGGSGGENNNAANEDPVEKLRIRMERAHKLKKQANAKFNKGDFSAARVLYTEGIDLMDEHVPIDTQEKFELMSNMHSNRAVTYFREKKFSLCIQDCDKAMHYDPGYDKSWVRKWRAYMALGDFNDAYNCLEKGHQVVPSSKRILEELHRTRQEKDVLEKAKQFLDGEDYASARDILRPFSRTSENIRLLFVAARADNALGITESALEKVNKALRFNPTHCEGLEIRGFSLFLTGETERGAHLLQEAYTRDKDNKKVKQLLQRCQKTHSAWAKGRSWVKRGRYAEAVDNFTTAIKECGIIPDKASLFGMLRTDRAEAWLLNKKCLEALKDCQEVIAAQNENASAWSIRAEVLITMGNVEEAKIELDKIRRTWGSDNPTIDDGYRRVDFELRVLKADDDLMSFLDQLEAGNTSVIKGVEPISQTPEQQQPPSSSSVPPRPGLHRHASKRRSKSTSKGSDEAERDHSNRRGGERKPSRSRASERKSRTSTSSESGSGEIPDRRSHKLERQMSYSHVGDIKNNGDGMSSRRSTSRRPILERGLSKSNRKNKKNSPFVPPVSSEEFLTNGENGTPPPGAGSGERQKTPKRRPKLERGAMSERTFDRKPVRMSSTKRF